MCLLPTIKLGGSVYVAKYKFPQNSFFIRLGKQSFKLVSIITPKPRGLILIKIWPLALLND